MTVYSISAWMGAGLALELDADRYLVSDMNGSSGELEIIMLSRLHRSAGGIVLLQFSSVDAVEVPSL